MNRVGLTGGIGSGKSTVADFLRLRGAVVIDADAISRDVTAPAGPAIELIIDAFGADFIGADGALDRAKMRQASYADIGTRRRLEAIIHPLVENESARQEAAAVEAGCPCILFDIPLLVESRRWRQRVDHVLVVDCITEVQIARVVVRSGLERDAIEKIIASQVSRGQRLHAADIVIFNAGDSKQILAREIEQIAHRFGL